MPTPGPERGELYATPPGELRTILEWTERYTIGKAGKTKKPTVGAAGLSVSMVAGARSNLHLRPEQVKMVAGSGYSAGASITPSFLAELAKLIHPVVASPQDGALFAATA
ncbi:hypothetical protein [Aureimonas altamirensis]|uniref:hypothetical protein n=1 Tax=Aureimonas altamirensis TaxID=370622 RepID=UPI0012E01CFA|nr:hypothetical protein [Aureimonas altamirensis]